MVRWAVEAGEESIAADYEPGRRATRNVTFVCAHGAGGNMNDRGTLRIRDVLTARGIGVVRFNFLYVEKGWRRPDLLPQLESVFAAVVATTRQEVRPEILVIGGRSMGGRVASVMVSKGLPCDGLLLLSYPLHPAGRPQVLRSAHLPSIAVPVLCLCGTRDPLCTREPMERELGAAGPKWTMRWLEHADHGFRVLRSSGRTEGDVFDEAGAAVEAWVAGLGTTAGR